MDKHNRKILSTTVFLRKFISVFFTLFFNIYVLKIVNDIGIIIQFNLIGIIFDEALTMIISSKLNNKNAKWIYHSSFIQLILCIILLITLRENICSYLYLFRILYAFTKACYYVPYENVIMGANTHKTMSNFLANINILDYLATILTPFFSGFIISQFSYQALFVLLCIEGFFIIIISSQMKNLYIDETKLNLKAFFKEVKQHPHLSHIYKCMFFRRISLQGAITDLLPVLLFLKVKSEFSVGSYNSIFAVISIISLSILKVVNKKNIPKNFYIPFAVIIFFSSIILIFNTQFITLLIYYIFIYSLGTVLESESCSAVYDSIQTDQLSQYKREHQITFTLYMLIGQTISYAFALIAYTYFYSVYTLSIVISIMMFFSILEAFYLQKTENYLKLQ